MIRTVTLFLSGIKRLLPLLLAFLAWSTHVSAQYDSPQNKVWAFGNKAGLDFNAGTPVPIGTQINILEGCASISDTAGNLLFYTNGTRVWDRSHTVMPHGEALSGDPNMYPTNSTTQSSLIVPVLDSPGKYYLFALSDANDSTHYSRLTYSVVDMSLHGGMGDIVIAQKTIVMDSLLSEKLTAVPGDHCNIWIVVHAYATNTFKAYEITGAGINSTPVVSVAGSLNPPAYYYGGVLKSAPNGRMLMSCTYGGSGATGRMELFHFNPSSGAVSDYFTLDNNAFNTYYGAVFSPDNSRLYVTGESPFIYQYDLTLGSPGAIINSKTDITQNAAVAGITQGDMQIGPDGRIYVAELYASFIGVINNPNLSGMACDYQPNQIQLAPGTQSSFGMPNSVIGLQTPVSQAVTASMCYFADSVPLSVDTAAWHISWDDGGMENTRFVHHAGHYWVTYYTPFCLLHSDTFVLHTPTLLPDTGLVYSGCKDVKNGFAWVHPAAGDSTVYHYTWSDASGILKTAAHALSGDTLSGLGPGTYTLHMQGDGCDTSFVFVLPAPDYQASFSADTLLCVSDTLSLRNTSTGSFTELTWDLGDGTIVHQPDIRHAYGQAGNYEIKLICRTPRGCYDTAKQMVTVDQRLDGRFTSDRREICAGEHIVFAPQVDSSVWQCTWYFGDGAYLQATDGRVQHAYDHSGTMPVQLNMHFRACPDTTAYDTVVVYPLPVVQLGRDTSLCPGGTPVLLESRVAQPPGYRYLWNTGDTLDHIFIRHPGLFRLQIRSDHGCTAMESVHVSRDCYIDIPNAFSPNGDGINDYFFPRQLLSAGCTGFHMQVFNRWGQQVFETTHTDGRGWDGNFNGRPQPEGVYIYMIDAVISTNHREHYQGNITLVR